MLPSLPCRISYLPFCQHRGEGCRCRTFVPKSWLRRCHFPVPQIHHSSDPSFRFLVAVLCRWCHGGCMDCFLSFNSYRSACLGFYWRKLDTVNGKNLGSCLTAVFSQTSLKGNTPFILDWWIWSTKYFPGKQLPCIVLLHGTQLTERNLKNKISLLFSIERDRKKHLDTVFMFGVH